MMQNTDNKTVDSNTVHTIQYEHTERHNNGDIRINNAGMIEEYYEGYWQEVPWKYNTNK
jgi:hypothetical protein